MRSCYFVEHPGQLLDKDRLLTELWPGLVVEENNLTQTISALRGVLGETPGENRYLATVPGRGYRFVAPVVRLPEPSPSRQEPAAIGPPLPSAPRTRPRPVAPSRCSSQRSSRWPCSASCSSPTADSPAGGPRARHRPRLGSVTGSDRAPASTVAVLPFENLSADAENAYVAFGVAESVLHRLASIPDLTLIARTSSFSVGERPADIQEIGRKLNARYLVEGSVQRSGERLRATAQLIDATTGGHLWSLRFDRTVDDIFAVEDEIREEHRHGAGGEPQPRAAPVCLVWNRCLSRVSAGARAAGHDPGRGCRARDRALQARHRDLARIRRRVRGTRGRALA